MDKKPFINNPSGFPLENVFIKKRFTPEQSERLRQIKAKRNDDLKEIAENNFKETLIEKTISNEENNVQ